MVSVVVAVSGETSCRITLSLFLGHVCVIESKENSETHPSNVDETNVVLIVSWNRNQNTKITLPFRPAVTVQNTKLVITDQEPIDTLRVHGVPSILSQIRIIPSHDKYITVVEDTSEVKTTSKYSVYLKSVYLKRSSSSQPQLCVYIVSEATDQNISVREYLSRVVLFFDVLRRDERWKMKLDLSLPLGTFY